MTRFCLLVLMMGLLVAGCRQTDTPTQQLIQIDLTITPDTTSGDAVAVVMLTDSNGQPISDATVSLRGDMTHAGMTPVLREAGAGVAGRYELAYEWTMGGDWLVEVTVTLADGTTASRTFDYTISS